jgi:hypothetical protein
MRSAVWSKPFDWSEAMKVRISLFATLSVLLIPTAVLAQAPASGGAEKEKSIQIKLFPMAEPRPALKYQLLPRFLQRRSGNAAVFWNGLTAEQRAFLDELDKKDGPWQKTEKWMAIPIGDPREKQLRPSGPLLAEWSGLYRDMVRAAQFESCDWELPVRDGNVISMSINGTSEMRTWGRLLAAKAHFEIAEGKYDQAMTTIQTGLALARHVGQGPILIFPLIGTSIAGGILKQVEQWIQQPDAPNLYWALSTLRRPLVDYRMGCEAEANLLYLQWPELQGLDKKRLSADDWRELLYKYIQETVRMGSELDGVFSNESPIALRIMQSYPRAKQYLIERGRSPSEVEAMPVAQVIMLYSVGLYDDLNDDQFKWMFLPYAASEAGLNRYDVEQYRGRRKEILPFSKLMSGGLAVKESEARSQWMLVLLETCEALRIYAAAHNGQLPDRLDDIHEVPVPANPYDGKPLQYHRNGNHAILQGEHGPVYTGDWTWRYEITMLPKAK